MGDEGILRTTDTKQKKSFRKRQKSKQVVALPSERPQSAVPQHFDLLQQTAVAMAFLSSTFGNKRLSKSKDSELWKLRTLDSRMLES